MCFVIIDGIFSIKSLKSKRNIKLDILVQEISTGSRDFLSPETGLFFIKTHVIHALAGWNHFRSIYLLRTDICLPPIITSCFPSVKSQKSEPLVMLTVKCKENDWWLNIFISSFLTKYNESKHYNKTCIPVNNFMHNCCKINQTIDDYIGLKSCQSSG